MHTHTIEYYTAIKIMKSCQLQQHGWMLSEVKQRNTNTYSFTYMWNLKHYKQNKSRFIETETERWLPEGRGTEMGEKGIQPTIL